MEAPHDDLVGSHSSSSTDDSAPSPGLGPITKRKRTQRIRGPSSSCTDLCLYNPPETTPPTEEEEDMAQCLIMLAQGRPRSPTPAQPEKFTSRRFTETTTSGGGRAGFYVYECKTCNKCFNSFQALGGHRASHKKPKNNLGGTDTGYDHQLEAAVMVTPIKVAAPSTSKLRVHECSICGAEFSSGQALGGHMRRHRPLNVVTACENQENREIKSENNVMLDLNLPAPADDQNHSNSSVAFQTRPIVFSSALVDCHY